MKNNSEIAISYEDGFQDGVETLEKEITDRLIPAEMKICREENQPTSRLTSLFMAVKKRAGELLSKEK